MKFNDLIAGKSLSIANLLSLSDKNLAKKIKEHEFKYISCFEDNELGGENLIRCEIGSISYVLALLCKYANLVQSEFFDELDDGLISGECNVGEKMAIIKGTKDNFEAEVLKAEGIVVVDFGANWCGPCKSLVPILDEVVEEDPNKKIVKVDIDEEEELAAQYKIMSVPTLLVFRNGEIIDKSVGLIQKHVC